MKGSDFNGKVLTMCFCVCPIHWAPSPVHQMEPCGAAIVLPFTSLADRNNGKTQLKHPLEATLFIWLFPNNDIKNCHNIESISSPGANYHSSRV